MNKKKNIYKAILTSTVVVPAMGIVAHLMPNKGLYFFDDASLSHRFECAYKLNPNPAHKTYISHEYKKSYEDMYCIVDDTMRPLTDEGYVIDDAWIEPGITYDKYCSEESYLAHPALIYPLHVLVAMGAYARLRRREEMAKGQKAR